MWHFVTTIPGAALGTVVKWAGERDVHKACVAMVRALVSPWLWWLLNGMHRAASGRRLLSHDSDCLLLLYWWLRPFYCKDYGYCPSSTIVTPLTHVLYCFHTWYCPHLRVVLSRYWDHPVDPSLILLSVLIQGCSALSQSHEFDTRYPLVSVTSSESSST